MKIQILKSRSEMSLMALLAITFFALSAIVLLISGGLQIAFNYQTQKTVVLGQQRLIAQEAASAVSNFIEDKFSVLETAVNLGNIAGVPVEEEERILGNALGFQPAFRQLALFDAEGRLLTQSSRLVQARSQEFANQVIEQVLPNIGQTERYISPVTIDSESGEPLSIIAVPIFDVLGDFQGTLAAELNLKFMWDLVDQLKVGDTGYAYVVDKQGNLLAFADTARVLKRENLSHLPEVSQFISEGVQNEEGADLALGINESRSVQAFASLGSPDWAVVTEIPVAEAFAPVTQSAISSVLVILLVAILSGVVGVFVARRLAQPLLDLTETAVQIADGDINLDAAVKGNLEVNRLAVAFNNMTAQLRSFIGSLERRVAARTRDLNLAAEIGQQISQVRHLDQLLPQAVQLVLERFDLYQTQIYLVDETGEQLVLEASTGHAGTQLLEAGHKLSINETSLNGTAAITKQAVIVADTAESPSFHPNPLLPDTRSEMVVPLIVGDKVVGVLDLQSEKPNALTEDNLAGFETLSGQLAIAIQNATLLNERRQAEAQVRERESLMRTIIDATPDWIFAKDINHRYMLLNKAFADTLQLPPDEVIGKHDLEIGVPEDLVKGDLEKGITGIWPGEREVMDSGQIKVIEESAYTPDGQPITLTTVRVPLRDAEGNVSGMVGFIHDITDLKQAEANIRGRETLMRTIIDSTPDWIFVKDVDHRYLMVNQGYANSFHITPEAFIGKNDLDIGFPEEIVKGDPAKGIRGFWADDREIMDRGELKIIDTEPAVVDGEQRWLNTTKAPLKDATGKVTGIVGFVHDITELQNIQKILSQRAVELETVAHVGTVVANILESEELMQQVVDLTKERFNLYHAHLYLLNEGKTHLVLTSGAGEVGTKMVAEGRRIASNQEQSLVARAARDLTGVVINNVQEEPGFLPHPLLPETRAEMAVPLVVGNEVLGVLDVQADEVDRFTAEDINIFTTLASQVAVALQNARRHDEALKALDELTRLQRVMVREGWEDYLTTQERPSVGYSFNTKGATLIQDKDDEVVVAVARSNGKNGTLTKTAVPTRDNSMAIPIDVRGHLIGQIDLRNPDGTVISARKQSLLKTVAHQVSEALERARLTEQTQIALTQAEKRGKDMAVLNNIMTQISTSLDLQHSLQMIVDELVVAVNVDQVRVALLQPEKSELVVIAEHFDSSRATSALGMTIPVVGNALTEEIMATRQMVVVEDAQNNPRTAPVHEMFRAQGIETVVLIPLVVNDNVLGTIGLDILDKRPISTANLQLAETIVYQAATAVQNARLFEQTQSALAETEMLYAYSSQLNTATNLDAVLESAAAPGFQVGAKDALLLIYDQQNTTTLPQTAQIMAAIPKSSQVLGATLQLKAEPSRNLRPIAGKNTVFVGDVAQDTRLTETDRAAFQALDVEALAIMFLVIGNLQLGQIMIRWSKPQTFAGADERLYAAVAQQASSVVYNRLLFNQTEEALSETAALYQASADINTAQTYDEVLTALRQHTVLGQGSHNVTISFFDHPWEKDYLPEEIAVLANWRGSEVDDSQPDRFRVDAIPGFLELISHEELLIHNDIATDERISPEFRGVLIAGMNANAAVYAPLIIGTRRIGFINGYYPKPMSFTEQQVRRLSVLVRQAAVSIQSIHLYEQTQQALAETEALYLGSESIVLSNSEKDVLHGLVQSTMLQNLDRANVFMFDAPVENGVPTDVTIVAQWENEGIDSNVSIGTRFLVNQVPFLANIQPDATIIVQDVRNDPRVDEQTCTILESFGMRSFAMYPLVAGNQWLGLVSGQSSEPLFAEEGQIRRATSLVRQAAVVIQTTVLFRQEQARARREQMLRSIAAKVRSSTDVDTIMRTAVTEIGRTLGRRSFIKLGNGQDGKEQAGVDLLSPSQQENGAS